MTEVKPSNASSPSATSNNNTNANANNASRHRQSSEISGANVLQLLRSQSFSHRSRSGSGKIKQASPQQLQHHLQQHQQQTTVNEETEHDAFHLATGAEFIDTEKPATRNTVIEKTVSSFFNSSNKEPSVILSMDTSSAAGSTFDSFGSDTNARYKNIFFHMEHMLFNLLYFILKGGDVMLFLALFAFLLEDLQMMFYFFSPDINPLMKLIDVNALGENGNIFISMMMSSWRSMTYETFMMVFFTFAGFVVGTLLLFLFATYNFLQSQHMLTWPLAVLRIICTIFSQVLFYPLASAFTSGMICRPDATQFGASAMGAVSCAEPSRIVITITGAICLVLATGLALVLDLCFFNIDPTRKTPLHKCHGRQSFLYTLFKLIFLLLWNSSDNLIFRSILAFCVPTSMGVLLLRYFPYYSNRLNQIKGAYYTAGIIAGIISIIASIVQSNESTSFTLQQSQALFACMIILSVFAFVAGYISTGYYFTRLQRNIQHRMTKWTNVHQSGFVFDTPHQVEFLARSITDKLNNRYRYVDEFAEKSLNKIFGHGVQEWSQSPYVYLYFGVYLHCLPPVGTQHHHHQNANNNNNANTSATKYQVIRNLRKSAMTKPEIDLKFQLFIAEHDGKRIKEASLLGTDVDLDVVAFLQYNQVLKVAKMHHQTALRTLTIIWKEILRKDFKVDVIEKLCMSFTQATMKADKAYMNLLMRYPRSEFILRIYARFAKEVLNESGKAKALTIEADMIAEANDAFLMMGPNGGGNQGGNGNGETELTQSEQMLPLDNNDSNTSSSVTSETTSSSSSQGVLGQSKRDMNMFRDEERLLTWLSKDIQLLWKCCYIIALFTCAITVADYVVISQVVDKTALGVQTLSMLHDRDYYTTMIFYLGKQMESDYKLDYREGFDIHRLRLNATVNNFTNVADTLYTHREPWDTMYTVADIPVNVTHFPFSTIREEETVTLYEIYIRMIQGGRVVVDLPFNEFSKLDHDNNWRFVADNFFKSQINAYDKSMHDVFFKEQNKVTHGAENTSSGMTVAHITVITLFVFVFDRVLCASNTRRDIWSKFMRSIPRPMSLAAFRKVEEYIESANDLHDDANSTTTDSYLFMANKKSVDTLTVHRLMNLVYLVILSGFGIAFSMSNAWNIHVLGEYFGILDQFGSMRTFNTRIIATANDMRNNDTIAWDLSESYLREAYRAEVNIIDKVFDHILYGDENRYPPTPQFTKFDDNVKTILLNPSCLSWNQTACLSANYNATISFSPSTIQSGLIPLQGRVMEIFDIFKTAAKAGPFTPDEDHFHLLMTIVDPFTIEGWDRCFYITKGKISEFLGDIHERNTLIFIFALVAILFGEVFIFRRIIHSIRWSNKSIAYVIVRMPSEIRKLADYTSLLENGNNDQHASGNTVGEFVDGLSIVKWFKSRREDESESGEICEEKERAAAQDKGLAQEKETLQLGNPRIEKTRYLDAGPAINRGNFNNGSKKISFSDLATEHAPPQLVVDEVGNESGRSSFAVRKVKI